MNCKSRVETRTYGTITHMPPELLSSDVVSKARARRLCRRLAARVPGLAALAAHAAASGGMPVVGCALVLRARPCALPCLRARNGALTRGLRLQGADVWAFSVLLFELITGKAAFAGMNHAQARSRLRTCVPRPLHMRARVGSGVPLASPGCLSMCAPGCAYGGPAAPAAACEPGAPRPQRLGSPGPGRLAARKDCPIPCTCPIPYGSRSVGARR